MEKKQLLSDYDNLIFDLYGTLIDILSDEWADDTWERFLKYLDENRILHPNKEVFREEFFALDARYRKQPTKFKYPEIDIIPVYEELFDKYGNNLETKENATTYINGININDISYKFRETSREYMRLFPGLKDFLMMLKDNGKKIYILSNAQASYTWPEIQYYEFDKIMDDVLMSSDYGCMKPDSAFYNLLIDRYSMDRSRTIMFGDSFENDYKGAIQSGINGLWLNENEGTSPRYIYERLK